MRLLVVDDALDIATLLKLAFELDGYAVDTALAGAPALELAAVNDYDVLILDLNLPDMDGMDVCRRLRAELPQLLSIMLTARSDRDAIIAGLDAGASSRIVSLYIKQDSGAAKPPPNPTDRVIIAVRVSLTSWVCPLRIVHVSPTARCVILNRLEPIDVVCQVLDPSRSCAIIPAATELTL